MSFITRQFVFSFTGRPSSRKWLKWGWSETLWCCIGSCMITPWWHQTIYSASNFKWIYYIILRRNQKMNCTNNMNYARRRLFYILRRIQIGSRNGRFVLCVMGKQGWNILFMGTDDIAIETLKVLHRSVFPGVTVYCTNIKLAEPWRVLPTSCVHSFPRLRYSVPRIERRVGRGYSILFR